MVQSLDRKRFVSTLGAAGLGLGLLASGVGAPSALARETQSQRIDPQLVKCEDGALDLSDEELKQLLIQLLREREQEKQGVLAFQEQEDAGINVKARSHDGEREGDEDLRVEVYQEFTQALANELGIDDPDEIDAAIRSAMMSVVDADDGLSKSEAERQKALIAAADVPIGPAYRGHGG